MSQNEIRLPKSASISIDGYELEITDYEPEEIYFHSWIKELANSEGWGQGIWDKVVRVMVSQGIKLEAVINSCVDELGIGDSFGEMIIMEYQYEDDNYSTHAYNFSNSPAGRQLAQDIVLKMKECRSWDQLRVMMKEDGDFQKDVKRRIRQGCDSFLKTDKTQ